MKTLVKISFTFSILLVFASSCSIQKRIYRNGYHIVWNNKHSNELHKQQIQKAEKPTIISENLPEEEVVSATTNRDIDLISVKRSPKLILNNDTCGDVLLLQNADELRVKIIEIDEQTIKYKRCDNLTGPTFSISKTRVALIKYANGTKEVVLQEAPVKTPIKRNLNDTEVPRKTNILGLSSLLLYILGAILSRGLTFTSLSGSMVILLLLLSIAPLVMAYISLFQFKREPNLYKGRWMPVTVVCFYLASLLIIALVISALASAFGTGGIGPFVIFCLLLFFLLLGILIAALIPKAEPKSNGK